jgi:acetylornithine deacetylase/succinyl-diaminopimelate desuccinylase-like protein
LFNDRNEWLSPIRTTTHAADEFVYVEDLVAMTKELVYYLAAS